MAGAFIYIRTSGDDAANEKLGVDVQRIACNSIARHLSLELTGVSMTGFRARCPCIPDRRENG
jgi:hypothetical protein